MVSLLKTRREERVNATKKTTVRLDITATLDWTTQAPSVVRLLVFFGLIKELTFQKIETY